MAQGVPITTPLVAATFDAIVQALLQGTSTVSKEQFVANTALTTLCVCTHQA